MGQRLYTADIHLTSRDRDGYRWEIFPWLRSQAVNRNLEAIFILGDLTDATDKHAASLVNRLVDELQQTARLAPIYILKGNHDYIEPTMPFFRFLNTLDRIKYIIEPTALNLFGGRHLFLPHTKTYTKQWETFDFSEYDFIYFHQALDGSIAESGQKIEGVPPAVFSEEHTTAVVLGGDQHVPQAVGNALYCGAPHPLRFGDSFQPRVLIWKDDHLVSVKRHCLKKVNLKISNPNDIDVDELTAGDQVQVIMYLPRSEFVSWQDYQQRIVKTAEKKGLVLCGLELRELVEQKRPSTTTLPSSSKIHNMLEVYQGFCKEKEVPEHFREFGQEIINSIERV